MEILDPLPRRAGAASARQSYEARAAKRIERAMSERNLSKPELCRRLGWPNRNRLDRYLTGARSLDLYTLSEIARALGVDAADLVPPTPARRRA